MKTAQVRLLVEGLILLSVTAGANGVILTFDDLIYGETAYNFDGDGDGVADVVFSTADPLGFRTNGPGANMTYIQEPGLEGTSLLSEDLRVDFFKGARGNVNFGFALDSDTEDDTATFRVYDAAGTQLASQTQVGLYTGTPQGTSNFPEGRVNVDFPGTASYGTFDFTSDVGRYIIDNVEGVAPDTYGLFVGVENGQHRGDLNAQALYDTVSANLAGFREGIVLTADVADGGVTNAQVEQAIKDLAQKTNPGDKFIFYVNSHGGTSDVGDETTLTQGDEWLALGQDLVDDDFTDYVSELQQTQKWVFLDICHAGGFWGNDSSDAGDLENLNDIALFAACSEDELSWANGDGRGLFGLSLIDAFSMDADGSLRADASNNYDLTFDELTTWIRQQPAMADTVVFEQAFGDARIFTPDMWSPMSMASPGFGGSLFGGELPPVGPPSAIPVPGAALLVVIGTSLFTGLRRHQVV